MRHRAHDDPAGGTPVAHTGGRAARPAARPLGFSLVETVVATILVAGLLLAALSTVGASQTAQRQSADRRRGVLLAGGLVSEISYQSYKDPGTAPTFGREPGEAARAAFDDVDDYAGYTESPPQDLDATPIPDLAGWRRGVTVEWVNPADLTPAGTDTGLKRVTVTITRNDRLVATLVTLKGDGP